MASPADERADPFGDPQPMPRDRIGSNGGVISSAEGSLPGSAGGPGKKKRVGFMGGEATPPGLAPPQQPQQQRPQRGSWTEHSENTLPPPAIAIGGSNSPPEHSPYHSRSTSNDMMMPEDIDKSHLPALSPQETEQIHQALEDNLAVPAVPRPRPAMRRTGSSHAVNGNEDVDGPDDDGQRGHRQARAREAFERAKRLEHDERSEPGSRYASPERGPSSSKRVPKIHTNDIPLADLGGNTYHGVESSDDEHQPAAPTLKRSKTKAQREAHKLVHNHTFHQGRLEEKQPASGARSGASTPTEEQQFAEIYRPRPEEYRGGILGSLLRLYNQSDDHARHGGSHSRSSSAQPLNRKPLSGDTSTGTTPQHSPPGSGMSTPKGGSPGSHWWGKKERTHSSNSLAQLIGTSSSLGSPMVSGLGEQVGARLREQQQQERDRIAAKRHSGSFAAALKNVKHGHRGPKPEDQIRITKHIAETISRQRFLMRLCKGLMMYGAPTHRLEEYMRMSARVLEIDAQFLYIPGSMIMSFDDANTHTTEVKLVKVAQGLDLGKLRDVHEVYKDVVHDRVGVDSAMKRLKEVMGRKDKFKVWYRIPVYGLAAVCVGPFAFQARLIDLPIAFLLGCILGVLQLVVAPASDLYANVFEVSAAVITSFLARAFGSIPYKDGRMFCFSALAQSSIALILPGYIVLCASLELQSRNIVAGSVRMVYAIIYSLFLGFGITIGSAIYGIIDSNATSATTCDKPIDEYWFFFFVPGFTMCLIIVNQAKWKQAPVMLLIAFAGYIVNYFSSRRFSGNTQIANTLGALAIGVLANTYSRIGSKVENWALDRWEDDLRPHWKRMRDWARLRRHPSLAKPQRAPTKLEDGLTSDDESVFERSTRRVGYSLAAAAMLPAIFVQVPSGLAVQGSLVSGLASANQIAGTATNGTTVVNGTNLASNSGEMNNIAFNVSFSVVQVAIGITVGLFLSAIVVYPFGKRRSGLFSF